MATKKGNFRYFLQRGQATGMQNNEGRKIRLRHNVNNRTTIQQNLSHMEQQAQKKKIAQEYYYQNKLGQSPMRRGLQDFGNNNRASVHNRLGNKIRLKRPTTTTSEVNPLQLPQQKNRIRLQRVRAQQPFIKYPGFAQNSADKLMRMYLAQNRMSYIRQRVPFVQRGFVRGYIQRGAAQRAMTQPGVANQRIRLRRNRPKPGNAINYTVQVANSAAAKCPKHHVNSKLNPILQHEIRLIQNQNISQNLVSAEMVQPIETGCTSKSLHERFSEL